jgi:hypothetical protein
LRGERTDLNGRVEQARRTDDLFRERTSSAARPSPSTSAFQASILALSRWKSFVMYTTL